VRQWNKQMFSKLFYLTSFTVQNMQANHQKLQILMPSCCIPFFRNLTCQPAEQQRCEKSQISELLLSEFKATGRQRRTNICIRKI